jgi:hypothetical protein
VSLVAVLGDCATTTSIALAAAWSVSDDVVVIEADPRGGSLAGWLDVPPSSTLSTAVTIAPHGEWSAIAPLVHPTPSGLCVLPAPVREMEASRVVEEAGRALLPALADRPAPTAIADAGRVSSVAPLPVVVQLAHVAVLVHRQLPHAAGAEAVRVERLADVLAALATTNADIVVAVIGRRPFEPAEVVDIAAGPIDVTWVELADDPVTAAVLAGRTGVSRRRVARMPLSRGARALAGTVRACPRLTSSQHRLDR